MTMEIITYTEACERGLTTYFTGKPCKLFNLLEDAQQRECFHFTNLQPLWKTDNRRKSCKVAA